MVDEAAKVFPIETIRAKSGSGHTVKMNPTDIYALLQLSRPSRPEFMPSPRFAAWQIDAHTAFDFIPDVLFAILLSYYEDPNRLYRVLEEDWVRSWEGWQDARIALEYADDDAALQEICQ